MNITRNNYEEYFLLYVDNELSNAEREAVENFIESNPDLREELMMLNDTILPADTQATLGDKSFLYRSVAGSISVNETNFEEYFVLYGDDELTNEEKAAIETFVYKNPQHQAAFELIQKVRYSPDASVVFPDKSLLYRSEKDERVVAFRWWRVAVAAAILLFLGVSAWLYMANPNKAASGITRTSTPPAPAIQSPVNSTPSNSQPVPDKNTVAATKETPVNNSKNGIETNSRKENVLVPQQQQAPLIAKTETPQIKNPEGSNIPETTTVTLLEGSTAKIDVPVHPAATELNPVKPIANPLPDVAVGADNSSNTDNSIDNSNSDKDNFAVLTSSVSSKNKMRGFFRKVTRVVEKATNIGPGEDKKGIHIANFEIALK